MIVHMQLDGRLTLEDPRYFRHFSVSVDGPDTALDVARNLCPDIIRFDDADHAWVSIAALKAWEGLAGDAEWQSGLAAMIEGAAPHGWLDPAGENIKAHVVWAEQDTEEA